MTLRDLDKKVAKFKGWREVVHADGKKAEWTSPMDRRQGMKVYTVYLKAEEDFYPFPRWSSDIASAWPLFEELKVLCCKVTKEDCCGVRYSAVIYDDPDQTDMVCVTADTAPEAITQAWIKWMENK